MNAILGVIDPTLLEEARSDSQMPLMNDGATASSTFTTSRSPTPPSLPRTRRKFTKDEITSWQPSNYAPRRDANESRNDYEERLCVLAYSKPTFGTYFSAGHS
jgi:hypothetical protein